MQITKDTSSAWYSIIIAILMIGFLLVLTTGILNLVLQEMNDGRGRQNYIKAYAAAEGWLELAMLQIKEKWYGFAGTMSGSKLLWNSRKDGEISYSIESKVSSYSGALDPFSYDILPLFWINEDGDTEPISNLIFNTSYNEITWNIFGSGSGIGGSGSIPSTFTEKKLVNDGIVNKKFVSSSVSLSDFLNNNPWSYLSVYNNSNSPKTYTIKSSDSFSLPRAMILSQSRVGKYQQNIETELDNTEFLWILKYSIFSK